ncbi:MAG: hypothetical protein ACOZCF_08960 [Bacillota bacterium]
MRFKLLLYLIFVGVLFSFIANYYTTSQLSDAVTLLYVAWGEQDGELGRNDGYGPRSFSIDEHESIYFADWVQCKVKRFSKGELIWSVETPTPPEDLAVDSKLGVVVACRNGIVITLCPDTGQTLGSFSLRERTEDESASGVQRLLINGGQIYIADYWVSSEGHVMRLAVYATDGRMLRVLAYRKIEPWGQQRGLEGTIPGSYDDFFILPSGEIYLADGNRIFRYSQGLKQEDSFDIPIDGALRIAGILGNDRLVVTSSVEQTTNVYRIRRGQEPALDVRVANDFRGRSHVAMRGSSLYILENQVDGLSVKKYSYVSAMRRFIGTLFK